MESTSSVLLSHPFNVNGAPFAWDERAYFPSRSSLYRISFDPSYIIAQETSTLQVLYDLTWLYGDVERVYLSFLTITNTCWIIGTP